MNSNYLLSMLGLVGNSLGLEQWLAHILPLQGQTSLLSCIGLLKVAQPNTTSVKMSRVAVPLVKFFCVRVEYDDDQCCCWRCCHQPSLVLAGDASPSADTYSLVASLLSPSQPPRTSNNLPFTGTLALPASFGGHFGQGCP